MWTINGTRIFATAEDGEEAQIIARLNPINAGTVLQVFGYDDEIRKLVCVVVGDTDMDAIKALAANGVSVPLSSYEGPEGDWFVSKVSHARKPIWKQTLRSDLDPESPVYFVNLELYGD